MAGSSSLARASSPSNSYYARSDSEEEGSDYNTIKASSEISGVKLLYSKSKVYVHPTPSAKDNIAGYIALLQQKPTDSQTSSADAKVRAASSLLLAWIPDGSLGENHKTYAKVDLRDVDDPPRQSLLVPPPPTTSSHSSNVGPYSFAVPVSAIYSLTVRPPNIGWWFGSIIINSKTGDSFPALFFHDGECQSTIMQKKRKAKESFDPFGANGEMFWGGDEVIRWLRRYVDMERCGAEPNVYLVNPSAEDKEAFGGAIQTSTVPPSTSPRTQVSGAAGTAANASAGGVGKDPLGKFMREAGWNILETFSKVTTFTRRAADSIADNPKMPSQVKRLLKNPEVQTLQEEFDSARIYLARWAMGIAEQSERERKQRIWTAKDVLEMEETGVGEFELLDSQMAGMGLAEQRKTVTLREWKTFFDGSSGRLSVTVDEVKERIFHGGLDADDGVRNEAWMFLLGVYDWHSSEEERRTESSRLRDAYITLKGQWWDRLEDRGGTGQEGDWWREQRGRIEKDVHRTDRNIPLFAGEDTAHPDPDSPFADAGTNVHMEQLKDMLLTYNEYNRDLGYVQGMSDLLAPIYAVMQDDALAFWGFQHFMDRMERNFLRDQSGMRAQLTTLDHLVQLMDPKLYVHLQSADSTNFFFFFRMLLVWYKREFAWNDILRLWECLWTDYLSSNFHLFIALAILEKHRDVIMEHLQHFDEVLKYVNELSNAIDLESTLINAESLFRRFQRTVEAVDKRGSFPIPAVRKRLGASNDSAASVPTVSTSSSLASQDTSMATASGADTATSNESGDPKAAESTSKQSSSNDAKPENQLPQVISPELRGLLSTKVELLSRKVVRNVGDGRHKHPA